MSARQKQRPFAGKAVRRPAPVPDHEPTMAEVAALVERETEERFDAAIACDGHLVFSRPGLRVFELPDGQLKAFQRNGYNGPPAEHFMRALAERQLEAVAARELLAMSPEQRAAQLAAMQGLVDSLDPSLRTNAFTNRHDGSLQQASSGSIPTRARWPTPPRRPGTRRT